MVKTNIRKLTKAQKEALCNKEINSFIIYLIYHLGNGSMLKLQLEKLVALFGIYKEVDIQLAIAELQNAGLLLYCQFPGTNKHYLYLSKFCIGRMEGLPKSSMASGVRLTDRGMMLNIFRVQNFMNLLVTKNLSVVELLDRLNVNGSTLLYKSQDALNYYLDLYFNPYYKGIFTSEFETDMQICCFETAHSKARKELTVTYNEENARQLKAERDAKRKLMPESDQDRFYFNFNNLLLSNIVVTRIHRTDKHHIKVSVVLYDIDNMLTIQKAYEKIANTYHMFQKYFQGRISIICNIRTYNQERADYLENDADTQVWDPELQKFKKYHKAENILTNMGLFPSDMAEIEVNYQNFGIEETYHILP